MKDQYVIIPPGFIFLFYMLKMQFMYLFKGKFCNNCTRRVLKLI